MKGELVDLAKHRLKRSKEAKRDALLLLKKGLIPKELSRILHMAFKKRIAGDYKDFPEFSKEETKEILSNVGHFWRD